MAAVLDPAPLPEQPSSNEHSSDSASPSPALTEAASGLKPIERLTSDARIARIIPQSDATTVFVYRSRFVRDFLRADYNFCASKVTVARAGKVKALDTAFREVGGWLGKTIVWIEKNHYSRPIAMASDRIELIVTHPHAGALLRCLQQYERVFDMSTRALLASKLTPQERENLLANAEKRIKHIVQVCIPDTDRYDFDGTPREA